MKKLLILVLVLVLLGAGYWMWSRPSQAPETALEPNNPQNNEAVATPSANVTIEKKGEILGIATQGSEKFVVDNTGHALYFNLNDEGRGAKPPYCNSACENSWLPYYFDSALFYQKSQDPLLSRLNIIIRPDGKKQYALGLKPLYRYYRDSKIGDLAGKDAGNGWTVARP